MKTVEGLRVALGIVCRTIARHEAYLDGRAEQGKEACPVAVGSVVALRALASDLHLAIAEAVAGKKNEEKANILPITHDTICESSKEV